MKATFYTAKGNVIASFVWIAHAFNCAHELLSPGDGAFIAISHSAWDDLMSHSASAVPGYLQVTKGEGQVTLTWPLPVKVSKQPAF